ncbi:MAG: alpha-L-fucosidase, partial [Candidatus Omnitrophica bacterium]|nr:alpha-L-fucosidase [Candidatus Omnitrophota bacterium]
MGCFVHFGLATYTTNADMFAQPDPSVFNPVDLDADQWVRAAKAMGANYIVLTAKHHSGFCLWPTETTGYSVQSSPWRGGHGDVVRQFVEAARRNGLEPGLYISAADQHFGCMSTTDERGRRKLIGDAQAYFPVFMKQLRELMSGYGKLAAVWFDGYRDPFAWDVRDANGNVNGDRYDRQIANLVRQYQPGAVISREGTAATTDVHWAGNESGWAPYPVWYVVGRGEGRKNWLAPDATGWFVPEANLHTRSNWFWTPNSDSTLRSVPELVDVYCDSIGRGANLLVNLTPNRQGLLPEAESERMTQFGAELNRLFGKPLAETNSQDRWDEGNTLELRLPKPARVGCVLMEEEIASGQRIQEYRVEVFSNKKWNIVCQGKSIGRKRIERFDPIVTDRVRLRVLKSAPSPKISRFAAFGVWESSGPVDEFGRPKIVKLGTIDCGLVETTPVVFKGRLYRFEYVRQNYPGNKTGDSYFHFIDHETGQATPGFAKGYHLGSAFVDGDKVCVTGTSAWGGHRIELFVSNDLEHWTESTALDLAGYEIFNTSMCKAGDRYVLMFEIGAPAAEAGVAFTARFATSTNLKDWTLTPPECVYSKDRYTAPHCLRYLDGYYYDFFLEAYQGYEMHVVRSKDLAHWESSPLNPVLSASADDRKIANPNLTDTQRELIARAINLNNSDIDFCEYKGRLVINYSWGNQQGVEFLAEATYDGTQAQFLKGWFPEKKVESIQDQRMKWWREARFGMFIHWGLYSVAAGRWNDKPVQGLSSWTLNTIGVPLDEYTPLIHRFNPTQFNPDTWVKLAKAAGMKYIVITSKHHEGFCLFDSAYTDYDVMSTPFQKDILLELSDACRREGIRLGFYYSILDWHHPDYLPRRQHDTRPVDGANFDRYVIYMKNQLRELATHYGPLAVLWFDGEWDNTWNHDRGLDLFHYTRSLQPLMLINNRVDKGRQGMEGMTKSTAYGGDFGTPEQTIPPSGVPGVDWETCMTINDTWGYKQDDHNWKSSSTLVRMLIDTASKGGNFLLNVGPKGDGTLPEAIVTRLEDIGKWTSANGEGIYGTAASPFTKGLAWGRVTQRKLANGRTRLYLHVFDWPGNGELVVPRLRSQVVDAYLLADPSHARLEASQDATGVILSVPSTAPDKVATVVVLDIQGEPDIAPFRISPDASGQFQLEARDADIHGQTARYDGLPGRG